MEIDLKADTIYLADKAIDFRCGTNTLCATIVADMNQNPHNGIYIFYNKARNRLKIIGWHRNGFLLIYKRLESGKFFIRREEDVLKISYEQLKWLLIGADWKLLSGGECKNNTYF